MTTADIPASDPVAALGHRGGTYYRAILADFNLDTTELEVLLEIGRALDVLEELAKVVAEGMTMPGSRGQLRVNPAIAEVRATCLTLTRLTAALGLPDATGTVPDSPARTQARRAAEVRWGNARRSG
jgi:hypothetical protein